MLRLPNLDEQTRLGAEATQRELEAAFRKQGDSVYSRDGVATVAYRLICLEPKKTS